jgi:hypothetical protein
MRVFDYQCRNTHVFECFVRGNEDCYCPQCDEIGSRMICAPRVYLDPTSGHFPGATMKWLNSRERQIAKELKANQE